MKIKNSIIPILLSTLMFLYCIDYKEYEHDSFIENQKILTIQRVDPTRPIRADGLSIVDLRIILNDADRENRKVTLTTTDGTFPSGEKTFTIELKDSTSGNNTAIYVGEVELTSSRNIGKVTVTAAIGEIKDVLELSFEELDFSINPIDTTIIANGSSTVPITITIDPTFNDQDYSTRIVMLKTSTGIFSNGENYVEVKFKNNPVESINFISSTTVTKATITGTYFDVEKSISINQLRAFPESITVMGEDVIMFDSVGTKFNLSAILSRSIGTPSKGHVVEFLVPESDANDQPVEGKFSNVTASNSSGIATAEFTVFSQLATGDLEFIVQTVAEDGSTIQNSFVVRVISN